MAMMTTSSQFRGRRHASITCLGYTSCRRHSHVVVRRRTTITTNSSIATLVVGASGGTGRAALQGMLEGGIAAKDIYVATRTVHSSRAKELVRDLHVNVVQMDLDEPNSVATALKNSRAQAIYVHGKSTSNQTAGHLSHNTTSTDRTRQIKQQAPERTRAQQTLWKSGEHWISPKPSQRART